jgi:hypothetical protein
MCWVERGDGPSPVMTFDEPRSFSPVSTGERTVKVDVY